MQAIEDLVSRNWDGQGGPQSALRKLQAVFRGDQPTTISRKAASTLPTGRQARIEPSDLPSVTDRIVDVVEAERARLQAEIHNLQNLASALTAGANGTRTAIETQTTESDDHPADTTESMFPRTNGNGKRRKRRGETARRSEAMRAAWARRKAIAVEADKAARRDVRRIAARAKR